MSKSLFYQLYSATVFVPHFDKHSDKADKQSDNSHIVKSLAAKKALNEFSHDFAGFIRSEYHIKRVVDITPMMAQHFLDSKLESGISSETAHTYRSYLAKLEKCVFRAYGTRVNYSVTIDESKVKNTDTIKQYSFTKEEMERILDAPRPSASLNALKFAYMTGVRVNTLERLEVRHLDFQRGEILVFKDKGSRSRVLPMDEQTAKLLRECIKGKNPQDKVFGVKKGSICRFLRRRAIKLQISTPDGRIKSGVHSIRKLWAEEYSRGCGRFQGTPHSKGATLKALGHGEQREELWKVYTGSKK